MRWLGGGGVNLLSPVTPKEPPSSEITPQALYLRRREFIKNAGLYVGTSSIVGGALLVLTGAGKPKVKPAQ